MKIGARGIKGEHQKFAKFDMKKDPTLRAIF